MDKRLIELAEQAGLVYIGIDNMNDQEDQFLGTIQQWKEFERLKEQDKLENPHF